MPASRRFASSLPVVSPNILLVPMPLSNSARREPVLSTMRFCSSTTLSSGRKLSLSALAISSLVIPFIDVDGSPSGSGPSDTMVAWNSPIGNR